MEELSFDIQNTIDAISKSSLGVKWKNSVAKWCIPANKLHLAVSILSNIEKRKYNISSYSKFTIIEPKRREIYAPKFTDKVVQRAICDNGVYKDLMRDSIYDSCACQIGKGVKFAQTRLKESLSRMFRKHKKEFYILKLDIYHFFQSIDHKKLKSEVLKKIKDPMFKDLAEKTIDSFEDPGLGLGCQISQLLANSFISSVDHMIKDQLGFKHYIRYCDDMIILHEDKEVLKDLWRKIDNKLNELSLHLNAKTKIYRMKDGFPFMKFRYKLTDSGRIIDRASKESSNRFKKHISKMFKRNVPWSILKPKIEESFISWKSRMDQGHNQSITKSIKEFIMKKMSDKEAEEMEKSRKNAISGAAETPKIYSKLKIVKNLMSLGIWEEFWSMLTDTHIAIWNNAQEFSSDYPDFQVGVEKFKEKFPDVDVDKILENSLQDQKVSVQNNSSNENI